MSNSLPYCRACVKELKRLSLGSMMMLCGDGQGECEFFPVFSKEPGKAFEQGESN